MRSGPRLVSLLAGSAWLLPMSCVGAQEATLAFDLRIAEDRPAGPLWARVALPQGFAGPRAAVDAATGTVVQLDADGEELLLRTVWDTPLEAGALELRLTPRGDAEPPFTLEGHGDAEAVLVDGRTALRFEHGFDADRLEETFKVFHHVGALHDDGVVTKGPGGHFSHHRGLFVGWNVTRIAATGRRWDFWHGHSQAHQRLIGDSQRSLGPVCADETHRIGWCDADGTPIVEELRRLTLWNVAADRHVIDVDIRLRPAGDERIELRGDPQHAGFQFRAVNEVNDLADQTRYRRPESAHGGKNDVWRDLSWVVGSFPIRGARYEVLHASHPDNPGAPIYSTRAYGRFGAFQEIDLEPGEDTRLRYRVIVALHAGDETAAIDGDSAWQAFARAEARAD